VILAATRPLAYRALAARLGGLIRRARVRLGQPSLDARIAKGESPSGDLLLALRAAQLVAPRLRTRLAAALDRQYERASTRNWPAFSAAVRVDAEAVGVARPALTQLAIALRSRESVVPRGVALARLLLTEPASPLYRPRSRDALYESAREALLALGEDRSG
jgi:hypothetical protein